MLSTTAIKKSSIVVVDDEHDLVELFSEILRSNGYDVHAFTDPITALKHVKDTPNNVLFINYRLPHEKIERLRSRNQNQRINNNIKVILISSYESIEGNRLGFELLNKPILIQTLLKKVKTYIK